MKETEVFLPAALVLSDSSTEMGSNSDSLLVKLRLRSTDLCNSFHVDLHIFNTILCIYTCMHMNIYTGLSHTGSAQADLMHFTSTVL